MGLRDGPCGILHAPIRHHEATVKTHFRHRSQKELQRWHPVAG
jgi:hypothetical protein